MSLYRSIIRQSFVVAWKHKYLWLFGLFATLLASNFEIELVNRFINRDNSTMYDWKRWADTGIFSSRAWYSFIDLAKADTTAFISLLVVFIVLIILLLAMLWLSVTSQGALVNNSLKALAEGSKTSTAAERKHDTAVGFKQGRKSFWPVLWVNVLVRVAVYILALVTLVPIFNGSTVSLTLAIVYFVVFIVLLAVALVLAFITKYAIAYIVLKNQSLGKAIKSAYKLFMDNWLVSLEMTFILFAISILFSLALILGVMVVAIPVTFVYIIGLLLNSFPLFLTMLIFGIIISLAIIVIGGAFVTVVQTTAWVHLFTQLNAGKAPESKLERVFSDVL
ncbi:MAG: hypothetical protein NTY12_04325 [Candidatus Falkowbacteria bacterium]|nr:hypothetical protein [Candidatus Falkowbacteria bacterium]